MIERRRLPVSGFKGMVEGVKQQTPYLERQQILYTR